MHNPRPQKSTRAWRQPGPAGWPRQVVWAGGCICTAPCMHACPPPHAPPCHIGKVHLNLAQFCSESLDGTPQEMMLHLK